MLWFQGFDEIAYNIVMNDWFFFATYLLDSAFGIPYNTTPVSTATNSFCSSFYGTSTTREENSAELKAALKDGD